jgi:hypothetical protein
MWLVDLSWQDIIEAAQVLGALAALASTCIAIGDRVRTLRTKRRDDGQDPH